MNTEPQAPRTYDYSAENLAFALSAHADRLLPGAANQLARTLGDETRGLELGHVIDRVSVRLGSPDFQRFLRPASPTPPPAPAAASPIRAGGVPVSDDAIAAEAEALGLPVSHPHARQVAQLRVLAAARHGDSVAGGLSGR